MKVRNRITKQKKLIYKTLAKQENFLSVKKLHSILLSKGEKVGIATIYRTLQYMMANNLIDSITSEGNTKKLYRLCPRNHHHHIVCNKCGANKEFKSINLEKETNAIAKQFNYSNIHHVVEIFGLCQQCR